MYGRDCDFNLVLVLLCSNIRFHRHSAFVEEHYKYTCLDLFLEH